MSATGQRHPLDLGAELALAKELAECADAITMSLFRSADLRVGRKADTTHVTQADTGAEQAMRALIAQQRPSHAVLGEEEGLIGPADASHRWILDPIDGTANYVRGVPVWATLIALAVDDELVLGLVSAPALGRRWWATKGGGAFVDGHPITVSATGELADAFLGHASVSGWGDRQDRFVALTNQVWRSRGFGDFWMHLLVAEGALDAACEPVVSLWDLAAIQVIVEEAGGTFTDLSGAARADGGSAVSSNGLLHAGLLEALRDG